MRKGFEKAVAVYSLSAVKPGSPQSHVGPVARDDFRPHTSHKTKGTAPNATSKTAIAAVETLPLRSDPGVRTKPFAATKSLLAVTPKACTVIRSNLGRNQVAASPSSTQTNAK